MTIGEWAPVGTKRCQDYYYIDTGSYDVEGYGTVYVVAADRPAVLDTGLGTNVESVLRALDEIGIDRTDLETIAVTHVHLDHAGGAGYLAEACPNASVYVHEIGAPHVVDPTHLIEGTKRAVGDQWEFYREPRPVPDDRVVELSDGDVIDLGDRVLEVHHAPGHAPHQVVFHDPDARAVKTADAAGIWVPAIRQVRQTTPPPNFDLDQCLEDVDLLRALEPKTLLYGHFGPGDPADELLAEYATVLPTWVAAVEAKRAELGDDEAVIEHFIEENRDIAAVWGERKARDDAILNVRGVLHYLDHRDDEEG